MRRGPESFGGSSRNPEPDLTGEPKNAQPSAEQTPPTPVNSPSAIDPVIQARLQAAAEGGYDAPIIDEQTPQPETSPEEPKPTIESILGGRTPYEAYKSLKYEITRRKEENQYLLEQIDEHTPYYSLNATANLRYAGVDKTQYYQAAHDRNLEIIQALQEKLSILESTYPDCQVPPKEESHQETNGDSSRQTPPETQKPDREHSSLSPENADAIDTFLEKFDGEDQVIANHQERLAREAKKLQQETTATRKPSPEPSQPTSANQNLPQPKSSEAKSAPSSTVEAQPEPTQVTPDVIPQASELIIPDDDKPPSLVDITREAEQAASGIGVLDEQDITEGDWESIVDHVERAAMQAKKSNRTTDAHSAIVESNRIAAAAAQELVKPQTTTVEATPPASPTEATKPKQVDKPPVTGVYGEPGGPRLGLQEQDEAYATLSDQEKADLRAANTEYVQAIGSQVEILLAQGKTKEADQLFQSMFNYFKQQPYRKSGYPIAMNYYSSTFCQMLGQQIECYNDYPEYQFDFTPGDPSRKNLPLGDHQEFMEQAIDYWESKVKTETRWQKRRRERAHHQRILDFYNKHRHYPSPSSQADNNDIFIEFARKYWAEHRLPGEFGDHSANPNLDPSATNAPQQAPATAETLKLVETPQSTEPPQSSESPESLPEAA